MIYLRHRNLKEYGNVKTVRVNLASVVEGGICVAASDGQRVYEQISQIVRNGDRAVLSFDGVTRMTTAFLNAAVGQLYGEFSLQQIKNQLGEPEGAEAWHINRLRLVTQRARQYFLNEENSENIIKHISEEK